MSHVLDHVQRHQCPAISEGAPKGTNEPYGPECRNRVGETYLHDIEQLKVELARYTEELNRELAKKPLADHTFSWSRVQHWQNNITTIGYRIRDAREELAKSNR